jgi:glycine cleavage system pyridoxal-binding protein P
LRYHPHTPEDVRAMLDAVGAASLDDLFRSIPEPLRIRRPIDVPPAADEITLFAELVLGEVRDAHHELGALRAHPLVLLRVPHVLREVHGALLGYFRV